MRQRGRRCVGQIVHLASCWIPSYTRDGIPQPVNAHAIQVCRAALWIIPALLHVSYWTAMYQHGSPDDGGTKAIMWRFIALLGLILSLAACGAANVSPAQGSQGT